MNNWQDIAVERIKSQWLLKALATSGAITVFMIVYFIVLRHPLFPVTTIPVTPLDRLVEFQPWALVPYASLWLYISLAPALLWPREQWIYVGGAAALAVVGLGIFLLFPTAIAQPSIDWTLYPSVAFLKSLDAAGNACPSMHVAFAVFTAPWLHYLLKRMHAPTALQVVNASWCLLIVWSTLAIKQHLAIDAVAGALLGLAGAGVGMIALARRHDRDHRAGRVLAAPETTSVE